MNFGSGNNNSGYSSNNPYDWNNPSTTIPFSYSAQNKNDPYGKNESFHGRNPSVKEEESFNPVYYGKRKRDTVKELESTFPLPKKKLDVVRDEEEEDSEEEEEGEEEEFDMDEPLEYPQFYPSGSMFGREVDEEDECVDEDEDESDDPYSLSKQDVEDILQDEEEEELKKLKNKTHDPNFSRRPLTPNNLSSLSSSTSSLENSDSVVEEPLTKKGRISRVFYPLEVINKRQSNSVMSSVLNKRKRMNHSIVALSMKNEEIDPFTLVERACRNNEGNNNNMNQNNINNNNNDFNNNNKNSFWEMKGYKNHSPERNNSGQQQQQNLGVVDADNNLVFGQFNNHPLQFNSPTSHNQQQQPETYKNQRRSEQIEQHQLQQQEQAEREQEQIEEEEEEFIQLRKRRKKNDDHTDENNRRITDYETSPFLGLQRVLFPPSNPFPDMVKINSLFDIYKCEDNPHEIRCFGLNRLREDLSRSNNNNNNNNNNNENMNNNNTNKNQIPSYAPYHDFFFYCLVYRLNCSTRFIIKRSEWCRGLVGMNCDDLEKIKNVLGRMKKGAYREWQFEDVKKFFTFVFRFQLDSEQSRNLNIQVAVNTLKCLVMDRSPFINKFSLFVLKNYRYMNLDQFKIFVDFSKYIRPDFSNYDIKEGAWPTMYDEFVQFMTGKDDPKMEISKKKDEDEDEEIFDIR